MGIRNKTVYVLVALTGFLALATGFELLYRLLYVLIGLLVVSFFWSWVNVRWLSLKRQTNTNRTQVGEVLEEKFTAENTGWLPKPWVEVRDLSDLPGHEVSTAISLASRQRRVWRVRTVCQQRGRYTLGPLEIRSSDPFGLFPRRQRLEHRLPLTVYPAVVNLPGFAPIAGELAGESQAKRRTPHLSPSVTGVRPYAWGDSFNRIHWPSTARTGQLLVKEFELDPSSDVWIVLDLDREIQLGAGPTATTEMAVAVAASVANRFLALNRAVGLIASSQHHESLASDRGSRQLLKMLDSLAVVQANGRRPLAAVLLAEGARFGRNALLIVVTPSTDEDWVNSLRQIMQHGTRVAVILLDATTFGGSNSPLHVVSSLAASDIPTYLLHQGDDLAAALNSTAGGVRRAR